MSVAAPQLPVAAPKRGMVSAEAARHAVGKLGAAALAAIPGLLTLYLSFNSGGFFPEATGVAVAVLAGAVLIRVAVVRNPFAGFSRRLVFTAGALAFLSVWTLLSASWSHSPSRALLYFDLANVYLFAVILCGSASRSDRRLRWMVALTWLSMLAVCVAALATRLRPDLFPIPLDPLGQNRLSFPLTYWNALGLFAVVGLALAAYYTTSPRQPGGLRVLGAAAIPVSAVTILLTYSRAAVVLGPAVLVAFALLARPRGLLSALLASGPTTAIALIDTYHAKLVSNGLTSGAAAAQGRHLTTTLLMVCAATALIRVALLSLDDRVAAIHVPRFGLPVKLVAGAACVLALAAGGIANASRISHAWHTLVSQTAPATASNDVRGRITSFNLDGRVALWKMGLKVFDQHPLDGHGADTFALDFDRIRPNAGNALQTHSLYFEQLSELGVVGLTAIVIAIVMLVGGCFMRARRSRRTLWIAVGLIGLAWAVHAAIDWDWQMPAVTLPVFALAAAALARRGGGRRLRPGTEMLLRVAVGLAAVAVIFTALRVSVSDANLTKSVHDFQSANCQAAVPEAQAAISAASSRPQPYAVIGFCDMQHGSTNAAVAQMRTGVAKDPQNWRYHYDLAIAQAAAGHDPHPQLRVAEDLDPLEPGIRTAMRSFTNGNRRSWPFIADTAWHPVELRQ